MFNTARRLVHYNCISLTIHESFCLSSKSLEIYVLNVFIDIQTSKELIQMDTDKMMTYVTFTMDDEKLTVIIKHNIIGSLDKYSINQTF